MLRIESRPTALPHPDSLAAILATSGNAVDALPAAYRSVLLLAVGHATARRARLAGFLAVESADGDADALASLVRQRLRPGDGTLLLAAGQRQGLALATALRTDNYRVVRRVLYAAVAETRLPAAAVALLERAEPHVGLFFSAETARAYVRMVQRAGLADAVAASEAVAIGGPAGMALEALPWRCVRVAARPTQDEMLALLQ